MPPFEEGNAKVAELVDALDSGSSGHYACGGSSPPFRTMYKQISIIGILLLIAGSYGCKSELAKTDEQLQGIQDSRHRRRRTGCSCVRGRCARGLMLSGRVWT